MFIPLRSSQFKRDVRRAKARGKDMRKLRLLLASLIEEEQSPVRDCDHPMRGVWRGYREVHLDPGWLLIYRVQGNELQLVRTGTHSDLFSE